MKRLFRKQNQQIDPFFCQVSFLYHYFLQILQCSLLLYLSLNSLCIHSLRDVFLPAVILSNSKVAMFQGMPGKQAEGGSCTRHSLYVRCYLFSIETNQRFVEGLDFPGAGLESRTVYPCCSPAITTSYLLSFAAKGRKINQKVSRISYTCMHL